MRSLPFHPAEFFQALPQGADAGRPSVSVSLLLINTPMRRIRWGCSPVPQAAIAAAALPKERNELAPSHSITSSARPSSEIGTLRPSAFAVLRLRNISTFVACCTGRSEGFSPLRMRPV